MQVHYRDEGDGDVILLIHGTGSSLHTWEKWAQGLIKSYRVIRPDLPAYGLTGKDSFKLAYTSKDYVDLINDFMTQLRD